MKPPPAFTVAPLFLVVFLFILSGSVHAASDGKIAFPASSWTHEKTYSDKVANKFGFGFLNITAGWTALFYELGRAKYFFDGLAKGTFYAFTNTAGGVLHAATFPVPLDVPLPQGGISYEYNR